MTRTSSRMTSWPYILYPIWIKPCLKLHWDWLYLGLKFAGLPTGDWSMLNFTLWFDLLAISGRLLLLLLMISASVRQTLVSRHWSEIGADNSVLDLWFHIGLELWVSHLFFTKLGSNLYWCRTGAAKNGFIISPFGLMLPSNWLQQELANVAHSIHL